MSISEDCQTCGLYRNCYSPFMGGRGSPTPLIMFVGEAPGQDEDMKGQCFVGPTGKKLMEMIDSVGIPRDVCRFNNAVQCRPPDNKMTDDIVKLCRPFIWEDIDKAKPKVIVALGNSALLSLTGSKSVTSARGKLFSDGDMNVMPTFHPAFGLRNPAMFPLIEADIKQAWYFAQHGKLAEPEPCVYKRVNTDEVWGEVLRAVHDDCVVSFDIETTGLNPRKGTKLVCFQISVTSHTGFLFLVDHNEATPWEKESCLDFLQWLLKHRRLTGHNLKFDLGFIKALYGWESEAGVEWDSCIAQHLIDENASQFGGSGLKELARTYTDKGGYDERVEQAVGGKLYEKMQTIDIPNLLEYSCGDTDVALRVFQQQVPKIEDAGLMAPFLFERDIKLPFIMAMEAEGVDIDWKLREELSKKYADRIELLVRKLRDYPEVKSVSGEFNPNSPVQVRKLCFDVLGLPKLKDKFFYTEKGVHSTGRAVFEEWQDIGDASGIAKEILEYIVSIKQLKKVLGTYLDSLVGLGCHDGKVHPNFNNVRTVTWRLSCDNPNCQQLPRGGTTFSDLNAIEVLSANVPKDYKLKGIEYFDDQKNIRLLKTDVMRSGDIKRMFLAPPGCVLMEADLSQIELRIAALFSQDKEMLDSFDNKELDMHRVLAAKVFNVAVKDVTPEQRQMAKIANFGAIYLITATALAKKIKVSDEQADKFLREFFRTFKGYAKWSKAMEAVLADCGEAEGLFGHRRHLPNAKGRGQIQKAAIREGVNFPIQNTASNMTIFAGEMARREIEKKGLDARFVLSVHDSVIWWSKKECAEETAQIVLKHMEAPLETFFPGIGKKFKRLPPIAAELKTGPNWGEMVK